MAIAWRTRISEVAQDGFPSMLPRDDMVNFMNSPTNVIRKLTILTAILGALNKPLTQGDVPNSCHVVRVSPFLMSAF